MLQVFKTKEEILAEALKLAELIASKSPIAVQATKKSLVYSLDHTNQEGLDQIVRMHLYLICFYLFSDFHLFFFFSMK